MLYPVARDQQLALRNSDRIDEFKIAFKISAVRLIGPLFPFFCICDFLIAGDKFFLFLGLRLSVALFCLLMYVFSKNTSNLNTLIINSYVLIFYPAVIINLMIFLQKDISSVYFVGLNLIASGAICFFPWKGIRELIIVTSLVYVPYFFAPLFISFDSILLKNFLVNCVFVAGSVVISFVIRLIYERLKMKEVILRIQLQDEIASRGEIIDRKTIESIRLRNLSKQFSPQIVKSINDGQLNLKSDLFDSNICVLFIDIQDSTKKLLELHPKAIQKVISLYVEDVMGLMLKYDITIDKFLGDGVLGFSNNPLKQDDYIERVLRCSQEIIDRLNYKRDIYEQLWSGPFNVRIGIAVGNAAVGFYGSDMHVKSYTAIGKVINLAARINGTAPSNGIVLTEDTISTLTSYKSDILSSLIFVPLKEFTLKGFESEPVKLFEVTSLSQGLTESAIDEVCPNGHGVLFLNKNSKGLYELTCRECAYVLEEPTHNNKKKAS